MSRPQVTSEKTFYDAGSLSDCLDELADERTGGRELAILANGAQLTKVRTVVDPVTGEEWVELI